MWERAKIDASLIENIIETMIELRSIMKALDFHGVSNQAFFKFLSKNPTCEGMYAHAQSVIAELHAEEIISIADQESDAARARNRIDSRKWYAAKVKPQKFGDRIDLNVNQIVDIGSALAEARKRVIDVTPIHTYIAESTKQVVNDTTGSQPDTETEHGQKKSSDDIFD